MRRFLIIPVVLFFGQALIAQEVPDVFSRDDFFQPKGTIDSTDSKKLYFDFLSATFFKDNEYFSPMTKGFTGIGYRLQPSLTYMPAPSTKISLGYHLLRFAGKERSHFSLPLFTIQQRLGKRLDLIMGNIYGGIQHQLEEPLYRFDRFYLNAPEMGVQFLWKGKHYTGDAWLDWRKFILHGDPFQENLVVGNTSVWRVNLNEKILFRLPLQFLFYHKGGQIDNTQDPVVTLFNALSGGELVVHTDWDLLKSIRFSQLFAYYNGGTLPEKGKANWQPYREGTGFYTKVSFYFKKLAWMGGYWQSHHFIAPLGEYQFLSISEDNVDNYVENRRLLTSKLFYETIFFKSVKLSVRAELYYDIKNKLPDYAIGLYLVANERFFLWKKR